MIGRNRIGDFLENHRFSGFRRRGNQSALAFADRGHQIHDPGRQLIRIYFQLKRQIGIKRSQVVE